MPNEDRISCFIDHLAGLAAREERGALAALRRGLGKPPGAAPAMFPLIVPWLSPKDSPQTQEAFYLVAALLASHPRHSPDFASLGATWRRLKGGGEPDQGVAGAERRFVALLNAHREDLPGHLQRAIALARASDVPVNYERLLRDLLAWNHEDRRVQRQWAADFWLASSSSASPDTIVSDEQAETAPAVAGLDSHISAEEN